MAAALLLTTACTPATPPSDDDAVVAGGLRLVAFESCEAVGSALREAARARVGPWGLDGAAAAELVAEFSVDTARDGGPLAAVAAPPPASAAGRTSAGQSPTGEAGVTAPAHSGTTVHEAGVDEPDLVKTDGRRIITLTGGVLRVVDAQRHVVTGSLSLTDVIPAGYGWQPADLLLDGDRALVLLRQGWWHAQPVPLPAPVPAPRPVPGPPVDTPLPAPGTAPAPEAPVFAEDAPLRRPAMGPQLLPAPVEIQGPRLLLVDLSGTPRVVSEYDVDGALVDARAVGPVVRVVVRSTPRITPPVIDPAATDEERTAAFREAVDSAPLSDWLPRYRVRSGDTVDEGTVDCAAVTRPPEFSATSMLTVLTFDLRDGVLGDGDPLTVVADAGTVYSNGTSLYVAGDRQWRVASPEAWREAVREPAADLVDPPPMVEPETEIHKFDVSGTGRPRYVGSGVVPGRLINQYALSEWDGHLRVATTTGFPWRMAGGEPETESAVYVLAERDGALAVVGSVGGLGRGERIYSVRFQGPVGYVVTFRETDPLYTVDLSDPATPTVRGELKITGYSSYLHPIGDGLLIGVGQEADERGVRQGTQVTLFDVSDLDRPAVLARHHVRYGHSEAEADPHAFLWWPRERMLVLPVTVPGAGPGPRVAPGSRIAPELRRMPETGVLVLRVDDHGITEVGMISHPQDPTVFAPIRRSLVVEGALWTVSERGLQANGLPTLATKAFLPFD